jgi:hypothetical protein
MAPNNTPPQSSAAHPLPRPSQLRIPHNNGPPRSISIAGAICDQQSSSVTPIEVDDRVPLMQNIRRQMIPPANEPPPPYEVAYI